MFAPLLPHGVPTDFPTAQLLPRCLRSVGTLLCIAGIGVVCPATAQTNPSELSRQSDPADDPEPNEQSIDQAELQFTPADANLTGVVHGSTSIGDVNNDEKSDLLVTGQAPDGSPTAILYLGNGQGSFKVAEAGITGVQNGSSDMADLNGDGHLDLLITGEDRSSAPRTTLYLGDGEGTLTEAAAGLPDLKWGSSSVADVNGDGHLDLLLSGLLTPDRTWANYARSMFSYVMGTSPGYKEGPTTALYVGEGTGTFRAAEAGLPNLIGHSTAVGDLNEDGHQDLLIAGQDADQGWTTSLYLGNGDNSFSEASVSLPARSSANMADVNGDGALDLLLTGVGEEQSPSAALYFGNGEGQFTEAEAELTGVKYSASSIADIDGNGTKDLLITGSDQSNDLTAKVYLGDGEGRFTEANTNLRGLGGGSASVRDVNDDGQPDLLLTGFDENGTPRTTLYLQRGQPASLTQTSK